MKENIPNPDDYEKSHEENNLLVFSLQDGSLKHQILLMTMPLNESVSFSRYDDSHSGGMFAGADCFVGTAFKTKNETQEGMLYLVNLPENRVSWIENPALENELRYIKTHVISNDRVLVLSYSDMSLHIQCFHLETGSLLWENTAEFGEYILQIANCCVVAGKNEIVISVNDCMTAIAIDTGEILCTTKLKAEIIDLYLLADGLFGFTLKDGRWIISKWIAIIYWCFRKSLQFSLRYQNIRKQESLHKGYSLYTDAAATT